MPEAPFEEIIQRIRNESTRWDAILELKLGTQTEWVDPLIAALTDEDWVIRWCCAEKLGDMRPAKAVPALIQLLADEDGHVRKNTVNALARYEPDILDTLVRQFAHPNPFVIKNVHMIIQKYGERALPELEQCIRKKNWFVANQILHAIWVMGGDKAELSLVRLLHYAPVQKTTIVLLGQLKNAMCIPYLVQLFAKDHLKRPILHTLRLLGEDISLPELVNLLESHKEVIAKGAYETLRRVGKPALPYLLQGLIDLQSQHAVIVDLMKRIGPDSIREELSDMVHRVPDLGELLLPLIKPSELESSDD